MVAEPAAELTVGALLGMLTGAFHGSGGGAVAGDDMVALIAWAAAACQVVLASVLWLAAPRVRARDSLRLAALSCAVAAVGTLLRAWEPSARYSMASALSVVAYVGHAALTLATLRTVSGNKSPLAGLTPWLLLGGAASLAGLVLPAIASLGHGLAYVIAALMYGAGSVLIFRGHRAWTSPIYLFR